MTYLGRITSKQAAVLLPFITGAVVHDLGAGNLVMAQVLLELGAQHVVLVEKEYLTPSEPRMTARHCYFDQFAAELPDIKVAFVSYPVNNKNPGLVELVSQAPCVIYLGKNTDGTACGHPTLFHHLITREVVVYAPAPSCTLIVYGAPCEPRSLYGEEIAGLARKLLAYQEVE